MTTKDPDSELGSTTKTKHIQIRAWSTKKLKEISLPPKLEENLRFTSSKKLSIKSEDVKICCNNNYLLVKVREGDEEQDLIFYIFDLRTGEEVFKMNNRLCSNSYS